MPNSYSAVRKELAAPELMGSVLVAANTARLRKQLNMSVEELALRIGWTAEAVMALEAANLIDLALDDIDTLAKALQVEPIALFT